jgi:hypothetical protein
MKRMYFSVAAVLIAVLFAACASTSSEPAERRVSSNVPSFVRDAVINTPDNALIGIGSARMATQNASYTLALTRARVEISRQMNTMVQDMVRDYTAGSEVDPSAVVSFQEIISVALSASQLTGSRPINFDYTDDGTCWVVVALDKDSVVREINQAQAAAKLRVPAMMSFDAESRMNDAFDRVFRQELQVNDR